MTTREPTSSDADPSEPAAARRPVTTHLRCSSCGYDLHGLAQDGRCPECGLEVAETVAPSRFDRQWLLTVRYGLRWMLASMYVLTLLVATAYVDSVVHALIAIMHFAGAVALLQRNRHRPDDAVINLWAPWLLAASFLVYLLTSIRWSYELDVYWIGVLLGDGLQAGGLAMLWLRLAFIAGSGIAPKIRTVASSLAGLTVLVGVLTVLPSIPWRLPTGTTNIDSIAHGVRLLWLVFLLVWFFASLVTLHLMIVPLQRIIDAADDASAADEPG